MELPAFYVSGGYFDGQEKRGHHQEIKPSAEQFTIDDLLDFSNEDALVTDGFFDSPVAGNSTESSAVTAVDSCNSSVSGGEPQFSGNRSFGDSQFSGDLCVPHDDLAELEWLSNFVEDSFSADMQSLQFLSSTTIAKPQTPETSSSSADTPQNPPGLFHHETPLPGKARSKRSRAAPGDWTTRLLHLVTPTSSHAEPNKPATKTTSAKKREGSSSNNSGSDSSGRKCLHCASEKTPQWRTGPMGPKTLCNACGVRYKSGRLVPEYRPAASPTFVSARHSNSHRKVLELRRQKEFHRSHQHQFLSPTSIFGVSNGGDEYLIHHRGANDFRQMM